MAGWCHARCLGHPGVDRPRGLGLEARPRVRPSQLHLLNVLINLGVVALQFGDARLEVQQIGTRGRARTLVGTLDCGQAFDNLLDLSQVTDDIGQVVKRSWPCITCLH